VQEIDPGALLEHLHRQVVLAAVAARRIRQRRRRAARVLDELLEIPDRKRRFGDHIPGDVAVGTGVVVDDDRLAQELRELLAHDARRDVGRTARGNGHDELDDARRILRQRCRGGEREHTKRERAH
jgi:hypothetical protein